MDLTYDMHALESLMGTNATIADELDSQLQVESPIRTVAMSSDCCSSNNY